MALRYGFNWYLYTELSRIIFNSILCCFDYHILWNIAYDLYPLVLYQDLLSVLNTVSILKISPQVSLRHFDDYNFQNMAIHKIWEEGQN